MISNKITVTILLLSSSFGFATKGGDDLRKEFNDLRDRLSTREYGSPCKCQQNFLQIFDALAQTPGMEVACQKSAEEPAGKAYLELSEEDRAQMKKALLEIFDFCCANEDKAETFVENYKEVFQKYGTTLQMFELVQKLQK